MNLTNPKRFAQSIEILRTLNFKNILEVAATGSKEEVGPLSVSVRGLQPGNIGTEANAITLSTNVVDVTNRLKPFIDMMRNAYREAGLLYLNHSRNAETRRIRQENEVSSTFGMILLKSKHQQRRYIPDRKIRGKLRQAPLPRYDFRDIINQYKDKTWSDEIKLDRVSICQLGLAKSLRHQDGGMDSDIGLSEVFSVPLP